MCGHLCVDILGPVLTSKRSLAFFSFFKTCWGVVPGSQGSSVKTNVFLKLCACRWGPLASWQLAHKEELCFCKFCSLLPSPDCNPQGNVLEAFPLLRGSSGGQWLFLEIFLPPIDQFC